jgi:hypothetical protein
LQKGSIDFVNEKSHAQLTCWNRRRSGNKLL